MARVWVERYVDKGVEGGEMIDEKIIARSRPAAASAYIIGDEWESTAVRGGKRAASHHS